MANDSSNDGQDETVAALAVGFSLGFGFLTVWEAIKQTKRSKNPRRSHYIYMIWGEIIANIGIMVLGYCLFRGTLGPSVPTLFFILFFWVFEIQLLMQIIVNRIAIISESHKTIDRLKWGTALFISAINIAVFCIFIPAHVSPPVNQTFVTLNMYWDRISKCLICLVDTGLNWYFLRVVKQRLVEQYGLMKYAPLVNFNARLMVLSVMLDVLLIGLMSLPNQESFILFHPVVYMSKLNIEISMSSLIIKLARSDRADAHKYDPHSNSAPGGGRANNFHNHHYHQRGSTMPPDANKERDVALQTFTESKIHSSFTNNHNGDDPDGQDHHHLQGAPEGGIQRTREFRVTVHHSSSGSLDGDSNSGEDEAGLTSHPGHPKSSLSSNRQYPPSTSTNPFEAPQRIMHAQ